MKQITLLLLASRVKKDWDYVFIAGYSALFSLHLYLPTDEAL
jgi:hypothetical protein